MIRRASIGVGISGLEGTAASRAADYSISQFRFLHTLLFVHGWWCYRRISKLSVYNSHRPSGGHSNPQPHQAWLRLRSARARAHHLLFAHRLIFTLCAAV